MSDIGKRSLRERRTPKAFDEEVEDPDPYGYGRPPYNKDVRTPSQQLNSDAKILVKFINHANKALRDHEEDQRKRDVENIREPLAVRERKPRQAEMISDPLKRPIDFPGQSRQELAKKSKELYNSKANLSISEQLPQKNEAFLNKIKTITMESANNMRFLEMNLARNKPEQMQPALQRGQSKQPLPRDLQAQLKSTTQSLNSRSGFSNQNTGSLFFKDKQKMKKAHELQDKMGLQRSDFSSNNKVFKRSAYHVAICYYIYLKKLKDKGPIGNDIDPTYQARRLKEEMSRRA